MLVKVCLPRITLKNYLKKRSLQITTVKSFQTFANSVVLHFLFLGERERENQHAMKKYTLVARETPSGEKFYELCRELPGAVLATKNYEGDLCDSKDLSDGKIFEKLGSKQCSYKTIQNCLLDLNEGCSNLF